MYLIKGIYKTKAETISLEPPEGEVKRLAQNSEAHAVEQSG